MSNSIIIGRGLIAREFHVAMKGDREFCIFASGVSNSTCTEDAEFERERMLLRSVMSGCAQGRTLVYFSTCSVYDVLQNQTSKYIRHKLFMEDVVREHPSFYIFRVPQVVGFTSNPYTLTNYFRDSIFDGRDILIQKFATRNIIDVSDVRKIVIGIINSETFLNQTLNIANSMTHSVIDILRGMEIVLGRKAVYSLVEIGYSYCIDSSIAEDYAKFCDVNFDSGYLLKTLRKYYSV